MTLRSRSLRWAAALLLLAGTVFSPCAFGETQPARIASPKVAVRLGAIDAQLGRREWLPAHASAVLLIDEIRTTLVASDLAAAVARLALADAGLGREEAAIWHWHVAQNLDRSVLSTKELAAYGPPGEALARHPLRRADAAPAGLTVLRPDAPQVKPARVLQGEVPKLSHAVAILPVPKALRLQAVIDAEGRLREPVVVAGGVPGMIYEMLEGLRDWRYEPARQADEPVAVFRSLTINPSSEKPLSRIVALPGELAGVEALLRARNWREAREQALTAWNHTLEIGYIPSNLSTILALRALAEAGLGMQAEAICRWQAAQHLNPALYDADLSPYGPAGELLEKNRWGDTPGGSFTGTADVAKRHKLAYPKLARWLPEKGEILLAATVGPDGAVRQPLVLEMAARDQVLLQDLQPSQELEVTTAAASLSLAVSTLDSVCDWRLRPPGSGEAAMLQAVFTVPYKRPSGPRSWNGSPYPPLPPGSLSFGRTPGLWVDPRMPVTGGVPEVTGPSPYPPH